MSQDVLWTEVCHLFKAQSPNTGEKFTELLVKAKEERLSLLTKTIEFLNADGHELIYVSGICVFVQSILELMIHSYQLSYDAVCDMLNFIIVEARHFSTPALVRTVSYCIEFMGTNDEVNLPVRWIEVFGKIVAVLATRGEIESKGEVIDGQEYKQEVITEICRIHWGQQNGASLIAALREIPGIDAQDVRTILDKAGKCVRKLEPASIPPIAYQLLLLAGSSSPSLLVSYFDDYFSGEVFLAESHAEGSTVVNKRKALGTTVYHFVQAARKSEPFLKELVKRIKASQFCHSLVVSPFMISIALGLTVIDYMKPVIIGAVKTTILKWFIEIHQSKTSKWYHSCVGTIQEDSVSSCFTRAIDARTTELDFMLDGLKELGVGLLNMEQTGTSKEIQYARKECSLVGDHILTSLLSKENDYLPILMNEFLKNQTSVINIECLGSCLRKIVRPFVRKKFLGRITELIHHLPLMTVETALPIFKALLPALQLSPDLLGEVVMVLRKTIWKSVEARKISVTGMILLLSNSRIVGEIPRSQYSSSQNYGSSQLSDSQTNILGSSNKNESICFEVLSILRRFFTQQLEVREHLYIGIYNVARQNPELIPFLCSHVQTQMQSYMTAPGYEAIRLDKMIEFSSGQTVLLEPLGFLVQCVSFLLTKSRQIYGSHYEETGFSDVAPASVLGCAALIGTWIEGIGSILSEDFNRLAAKILPPGQSVEVNHRVKAEFIIQVMQVTEALIEYLCLGGEPKQRNDLLHLFAKFNEMKAGLKPPSVSKKGKKRKAPKDKDDSDSTLQLTGGSTSAGDFLPPKDAPPKKLVYYHIMATENLSDILGKLYMFEDLGISDTLAPVRNDKGFDTFLLGILKQKLNSLKHKDPLKEREKDPKIFNSHLSRIAQILWDRANKDRDVSELSSEDDELNILELPSVIEDELRLELTLEILDYLYHTFPSDRQLTLSLLLNQDVDRAYGDLFTMFFDQFTLHIQHAGKYVEGKRDGVGINHLFKILELISSGLTTAGADELDSVLTWFTKFLTETSTIFTTKDSGPEPSHAEAILSAFMSLAAKHDEIPERFLPLAKRAHFLMRDLAAETPSFAPKDRNEKFWLVNEKTAPVILHQFCLYTENTLDAMKDIMGRLSCIYVDEEKVATWRENCCVMMQFLVQLLTHLVRSKFPIGPWVDVLRRTTVQFFNMMTSITESFVSYHTKSNVGFQSKGFEALVKAIGTDFKIRAEAMVHHIEEIRRKALESAEEKKKNSAKISILKDTRTMPALIYSIERYEQQLIALCQKTHVNLLVGTRLSAPRDFRIIYKPTTK